MGIHERQALVAECRASGMTAKAWCESKGIDYRRYVTWATKVNREKHHAPLQWADVTIQQEEHIPGEIQLTVANGPFAWNPGSTPKPGTIADLVVCYGRRRCFFYSFGFFQRFRKPTDEFSLVAMFTLTIVTNDGF